MKKLTAILLSLIMVFSLFAVPAAATDSSVQTEAVAEEKTDLLGSLDEIVETIHNIIHMLSEFFDFECPFDEYFPQEDTAEDSVISPTLENPEFVSADNEATNVLANGD